MSEKKERIDEFLLNAEPGAKLWTVRRINLYDTHEDLRGKTYFGEFKMPLCGRGDDMLYMVWTARELVLFGEMSNEYCEGDVCYVFRDAEKNLVYYIPNKYYEEPFRDESLFLLKKLFKSIPWEELYLTREDAVEFCRKLNSKGSAAPLFLELGKTLESMKTRMDAFVKNGYYLDIEEAKE